MRSRYVLCRPQGGLNDLLCQIEKCCRYAEQTGRRVVVDTDYQHSRYFNDDLSRYFCSRQSRLVLSRNEAPDDLIGMSVYPDFVEHRLNEYAVEEKEPFKPIVESVTRQPVTFDFSRFYDQEVLVHHQDGGGQLSLFALLRMGLAEELKRDLEHRLIEIGGPYMAIHVRNTDYLSDYSGWIEYIKKDSPTRLFVASDDQRVITSFRNELPSVSVYSFSRNLSTDGSPLHQKIQGLDKADVFARNSDAILDLLLLALSNQLILSKISGRKGSDIKPEYSGYSLLAKNLRENKTVLKYFLAPTAIRFGLD